MTIEERIFGLHREAHNLAFACYIRKGFVPPHLPEIINATTSLTTFLKYNPDEARVPAGSGRESGRWTNGGGGNNSADSKYPQSKIKSQADAKKVVEDNKGSHVGKSSQCASLTHALAPDLPVASAWKPGDLVQDNTSIPLGTPVATFNYQNDPGTNGYGPADAQGGLPGSSHTGIYLGQDQNGMEILNQYSRSNGPKIETIPWDFWNGKPNEAGSHYYRAIQSKP